MTVVEVIEQINTYISRCYEENGYQGTHDEQISLKKIIEYYKNLTPSEQKDVRDNFHVTYEEFLTLPQKYSLVTAKEYRRQAAIVCAFGGVVGGVLLGSAVFKTVAAGGIGAFAGSFFSKRYLEYDNTDLILANKKMLILDRIKSIFEFSKPVSEIKLSLPDFDAIRERNRRNRPG